MKNIIVHIGVHKTGTTSIQAFIKRNEACLNSLGICFPKAGCVDSDTYKNIHNIAWEILGIPTFNAAAGTLRELLKELSESRFRTGVLSAEDLEFLTLQQAQELRSALSRWDVTLLVYLRRHDELFVSEYCHQLRGGVTSLDFKSWRTNNNADPRYDYLALLDRWSRAGYQVKVRPYDKRFRLTKDLCLDFAREIGVSDSSFSNLEAVSSMNVKLSGPVSVMLQSILSQVKARYDIEDSSWEFANFVWWHLERLLPDTPEYWPFLERGQRDVLAEYGEMYDAIELKYCAGLQMFSRDLEHKGAVATVEQLSSEDAASAMVEVVGALWVERQRDRNRQ